LVLVLKLFDVLLLALVPVLKCRECSQQVRTWRSDGGRGGSLQQRPSLSRILEPSRLGTSRAAERIVGRPHRAFVRRCCLGIHRTDVEFLNASLSKPFGGHLFLSSFLLVSWTIQRKQAIAAPPRTPGSSKQEHTYVACAISRKE